MGARRALEARWLELTRSVLPAVAGPRGWPIRLDHCFQRVLLDCAFGGVWYEHVAGRPAYRAAPVDALARAVALGERVAAGRADLAALNARSLAWRGRGGGLGRARRAQRPNSRSMSFNPSST
ncbi:MAG: GCN5-related N-acetyltransferase [Sphingomonadaceae bacterium]|nr:GCN5-related N-acetyltransferase [Sphingomonadaceae bacterium]